MCSNAKKIKIKIQARDQRDKLFHIRHQCKVWQLNSPPYWVLKMSDGKRETSAECPSGRDLSSLGLSGAGSGRSFSARRLLCAGCRLLWQQMVAASEECRPAESASPSPPSSTSTPSEHCRQQNGRTLLTASRRDPRWDRAWPWTVGALCLDVTGSAALFLLSRGWQGCRFDARRKGKACWLFLKGKGSLLYLPVIVHHLTALFSSWKYSLESV